MLFEFNVENKKDELFNIEEAFLKGNSYKNLYNEYKNYKPKNIMVKNEQEAMLVKIMSLEFGITDLNLKLAIDPNNKTIYEKFTKYSLELDKLKKEYNKKYQVLDMCDDLYGKYTYYSNPWPWEGFYV